MVLILSSIELLRLFLFMEEKGIDSIIKTEEDGKRVFILKDQDELQRHVWQGEAQLTKQEQES